MINQVNLPDSGLLWEKAYAENLLHVPFLTHSWHTDWSDVFGGNYSPMYLSVGNSLIAPFVINNNTAIFSGGAEGADYLDIIGPDDKKAAVWTEILPFLKSKGVTGLLLRNVPENSPTVSFFRNIPHALVEKEDTTPQFPLPATWEQYIKSLDRKNRHELERKIRKFEREHIDAEIHESNDPSGDIGILIDLMLKDPDKQTFLTPDMQKFFRMIAKSQSERISLLYISMGDKKASATLSFIEDGITYLYNSGFDKECCANAGFYLKAMTIKKSIEKKLNMYNFLQGQERYKYELGGRDFFVWQITHKL